MQLGIAPLLSREVISKKKYTALCGTFLPMSTTQAKRYMVLYVI